MTARPKSRVRVAVWDLPVRLFHWSLPLLIGLAWWSAKTRALQIHRLCGYAILTLLLFRLGWGLIGSTTARFASFVAGPRRVFAYLRGAHRPQIGHNPAGGWSVLALLLLLLLQSVSGLFASDVDGFVSGPLARLIDYDASRWSADLHAVAFNGLLTLVALHVAAVLFHALVKHDDLISPMLSGRRELPVDAIGRVRIAPLRRAGAVLLGSGVLVFLLALCGQH